MKKTMIAALIFLPTVAAAQVAVIDDNGTPLGIFLESIQSGSSLEGPRVSSLGGQALYHLISHNSYRFIINFRLDNSSSRISHYWLADNLDMSKIYFETDDCSGQAYMHASHSGFISRPPSGAAQLWYAPIEQNLQSRTFQSVKAPNEPNDCMRLNPRSAPQSVRVYANDPSVTGLTVGAPVPPFRFESSLSHGLLGCLFNDSFECPLP